MDPNAVPSLATLIIGDKTLDVDEDYEEIDLNSEQSPEILKKKKFNAKKANNSGSKGGSI